MSKNKSFLQTFLIIIGFLILALISKPHQDQHLHKIEHTLFKDHYVNKTDKLAYFLGKELKGQGQYLEEILTYHDYLVFSTTTFQNKSVSIGFFGYIILLKDVNPSDDSSSQK